MRRLLRANIQRLWKDRVFQLCTALMFLIGLGIPVAERMAERRSGWEGSLETSFFSYAILIGIAAAVVTALYVGTEYSDGAMRNKIMVGHKRGAVYLANLITCEVAGVLLCGAYFLGYLGTGIPLLGFFDCGLLPVLLLVLLGFAMMAAFIALFVLVAMLCQNKAYTAVGCVLLAFLLLFAGVSLNSSLNEPEYYDGYSLTTNGVTVSQEQEPNPNYLSGTKREIYAFLFDFVPGGQAVQLAGMAAEHPARMALCDLLIVAAATGCGAFWFRRKDLR